MAQVFAAIMDIHMMQYWQQESRSKSCFGSHIARLVLQLAPKRIFFLTKSATVCSYIGFPEKPKWALAKRTGYMAIHNANWL